MGSDNKKIHFALPIILIHYLLTLKFPNPHPQLCRCKLITVASKGMAG